MVAENVFARFLSKMMFRAFRNNLLTWSPLQVVYLWHGNRTYYPTGCSTDGAEHRYLALLRAHRAACANREGAERPSSLYAARSCLDRLAHPIAEYRHASRRDGALCPTAPAGFRYSDRASSHA